MKPEHKQLPIVINNYNRLKSTQDMVKFLLLRGFENIIILDNNSNYPPLTIWYNSFYHSHYPVSDENTTFTVGAAPLNDKYAEVYNRYFKGNLAIRYVLYTGSVSMGRTQFISIVRLRENFGAHAVFDADIYKQLGDSFIYTDADLKLNDNMPEDFVQQMYDRMEEYNINKVGLALCIDDFQLEMYGNHAILHESQFWVERLQKDVYLAPVDTTFCLVKNCVGRELHAIRMAGNFTAKHLPWYVNFADMCDEDTYFARTASNDSNFGQHYRSWLQSQNNP